MKTNLIILLNLFIAIFQLESFAQEKKAIINDSNTPLHLLKPEYKIPYGDLKVQSVKNDIDRILNYLKDCTPTNIVDKKTGKKVNNFADIDTNSELERGKYRLASYEWGVTYSAMLAVSKATGDKEYEKYVTDRFNFISKIVPYFKKIASSEKIIDPQMRQIIFPQALDDAGAVCAAMIKVQTMKPSMNLMPIIDNYMDFIMNKEYRLSDGTFARTRPHYNTVWLDDMFMGIPPIIYYSKLSDKNSSRYISEAVRQVLQFAERMWVPEKNLFRHGWVEAMKEHPAFHWGRANGWAILTMCEVLDVLPENHPNHNTILDLLRKHIKGIASLQSGEGLWHQLLDRNDSYLETSASAIFTYCIAHAINKGWIDAMAYGPIVQLGWEAISTQINENGEVENTCVGTGMAFDPAFYYYRPVNVYAAHGYGPVIWAGAEVITLLKNQHPKMNDSAIQYYNKEQNTNKPIFHVTQ